MLLVIELLSYWVIELLGPQTTVDSQQPVFPASRAGRRQMIIS